jgi:hypothetical protein
MSKFLLIDNEFNVIHTDVLTEDHKVRTTGINADLIIIDVSNPDNPQELDPFTFNFNPVISEEDWLEHQRVTEEECDFGMGSPC